MPSEYDRVLKAVKNPDAARLVVETVMMMHSKTVAGTCYECGRFRTTYPCATMKAIAKAAGLND